MNNEIDGILRGLRADVQQEILNHLGGEGVGLVRSFVLNCTRHGVRVSAKLRDLRDRDGGSLQSAMIDAAARKASAIVSDAIKAAEKLKVEWSQVQPPFPAQASLYDHIRKAPARKAQVEKQNGNVEEAFKTAAKIIEAEYEWPFQSHASMGPACALVEIKGGQFRFRPFDEVVGGFAPYTVDANGAIRWGGRFGGLDDPPAKIVGSKREAWGFNVMYQGSPGALVNTMSCHAPGK